MERSLYLLRHSYAEKSAGVADIARSLTMKGTSAVRTLGHKLFSDGFDPQEIITSPAKRARETAINLIEELGISEHTIRVEDEIYTASVRELLEIINALNEDSKKVVIIGHNPFITYFAEFLTHADIGNIKPCGLVHINFENIGWDSVSQGSGIFRSHYHPGH